MSALAILTRLRAGASIRYISMPIDWSQANANKKLLVSKTSISNVCFGNFVKTDGHASVRYISMPNDWSQPNSNKKLQV